MATNEDINIKVHSEGGERAIGITPEQTERSIGINNEAIVVRSVKSYNDLDDKPQINSVELEGDKSASDLGFADVAMSGSYNDLTDTPEIPAAQVNSDWNADSGVAEILNKPTIPTKTSQLDNDSGFLTSESDPVFSASAAATITSQDITDWNNKSDFSGNYNDLTNKPTIPTKTSDLTNDGADNTSTYVEADELATVATSGSYNDLTNKPTIPAAQVNSDWNADSGVAQILNKPNLATVATSGDYDDLINKPAPMTVDSALSWTSQNPVENQAIRKTIYVKNSSDDREAGINIAFSNPNLNPYVHLGSKTSATKGTNSVGIGNNAESSAVRSVAIGNSATASKREGVALGPNATAGQYSLSIGYYTETVPNYSTAVGPYAKVLTGATNATAIGYQSEASEAETVSVGKSTKKRRIVNVADGTTATDAATVGQIPTKTSDLTNDGADNTSTYVEADELAAVATSGSYNDLSNKPTIPAAQVNSDWDAASGVAQILNKPSLAAVATSGLYSDLTGTPTIPTVNNATLTIQQNGTNVQTFTANQSTDATANITVPTKTSDLVNDGADNTSTYLEADETAYRGASIPFGIVDNTSTSTVFTATVPGITELRDGVCMWLKNGTVTSASGFTINVNNLGAKPVYSNMSAASAEGTLFNVNYTFMFVYDSSRVAGGCWVLNRGYFSDANSVGYQIRTNSSTLPALQTGYRYRLWLTSADGQHYVPINTATGTSTTSTKALNTTTPIDPFGTIVYNATNGTVEAGANLPTGTQWTQFTLDLRYAKYPLTALTSPDPVYLQCTPQSTGGALINDIVQTLPTTEDGKIYIYLGNAYSTVSMELKQNHPVYYYKDGAIRLWANQATGVTSFNGSTGAVTYTAPVTSVNGSTGAITGLQTTNNLVTSVSGSSTDSQYPSAKLFYDTIGNVETILNTLNNGGGAQ